MQGVLAMRSSLAHCQEVCLRGVHPSYLPCGPAPCLFAYACLPTQHSPGTGLISPFFSSEPDDHSPNLHALLPPTDDRAPAIEASFLPAYRWEGCC